MNDAFRNACATILKSSLFLSVIIENANPQKSSHRNFDEKIQTEFRPRQKRPPTLFRFHLSHAYDDKKQGDANNRKMA